MNFAELDLIAPLQRAVAAAGYTEPTPIQEQAIPPLLAGRDVLGCAQTGTGKTAAFALPVLQYIANNPLRGRPVIRVLVLSPTRELAAQIGQSFRTYGKHLDIDHVVLFGGVSQRPQVSALRRGVEILVATPGRLLDLQQQGFVHLEDVEFFILDEADRMLDMGFIRDIRKVLTMLPEDRQNLLFSATMPKNIATLGKSFMVDPIHVEVTPQATTVERIDQSVMFVAKENKRKLLVHVLEREDPERALVFTRTKHGANRVVKHLEQNGFRAAAIHGNKSQNARERALGGFRDGSIPVLVATDVASRGIDVDGVSHVFNFDLPNEPESYVHRIGRTARAGRDGVAIAFSDEEEGYYFHDIQRLIGMQIPVDDDHPYHSLAAMASRAKPKAKQGRGRSGGGHRQGRNNRRRY